MEKKFKITMAFGETLVNRICDGQDIKSDEQDEFGIIETFEFDTEAELDAFCLGVCKVDGWNSTMAVEYDVEGYVRLV